jgi:tetratricopeptide (TPR) repeat protein
MCLAFSAFAEDRSSENLFERGLAAFQNKDYPQARDHFQKLLEQNTVSAAVLHNLALSYFQLDQAPMALALWRKALTLEPGFRPARAGRDFAELKLQARGFERNRISEAIQRNLEFISFYESLWLIALVLGGAGWLWIRYFADRRQALDEEAPRPAFPITAVLLTLILASAVALSAMKLNVSLKTRATVITKKSSAKSLPAEDGVALFDLGGGVEVLIRRRDKEWSQVQNSEGSSGWIKNDDLLVTSQ